MHKPMSFKKGKKAVTFEEVVAEGSKRKEPAKERYTCNDCPDKETCEFAYDLYNLDGDCLMDK